MAEHNGELEAANGHGMWIRSVPSFENIPTFPDDLDLDFAIPPTEVTEVGERLNRGPATDPPSARLAKPVTARVTPSPLFDEAPDPFERTPATFDMGMMPASVCESEVTEEISTNSRMRPRATTPKPPPARIPAQRASPPKQAPAFAQMPVPSPDAEPSVTLELLEDWMERIDDIDLSSGIHLEQPRAKTSPGMIALDPLPGGRRSTAPQPAPSNPALARRAPPPGRPDPPSHFHAIDPRSRPTSRSQIGPRRTQPYSSLQQAGWWTAGALSGVLGASIITGMSFAIVLLV